LILEVDGVGAVVGEVVGIDYLESLILDIHRLAIDGA